MTTPLEVQVPIIAQPHLPLILASAGFLTTLKAVEDEVAAIKITDAQSAQAAANLTQRLTDAGRKLEEGRVAIKAPFLAQCAAIDDAARAPALRITAAKDSLKRGLTAYANKAAEEERARRAELARLEELRAEEEYQAAQKAREATAKINPAQPIWDDEEAPALKTQTQVAIEAVKAAVAVAPAKPAGVRFRVTLAPLVVDIKQVPDQFVDRTLKLAAVKATYCNGFKEGDPLPVCAGIKFEVTRTAESTGRAGW